MAPDKGKIKIVAEVERLQNNMIYANLRCVEEDEALARSVTSTLLDQVSQMYPDMMDELEKLFVMAEKGMYVPDNPFLPDWGVNDMYLWISRPGMERDHILLSNDYVEEFSQEYGQPQLFTTDQYRAAFRFWMEFQELCRLKGKENMVGEKVYGVI